MFNKCPCGKSCCKNGTCAGCTVEALGDGEATNHAMGMGGYRHHSAMWAILGVLVAILIATLIANNLKKYHFIGKATDQSRVLAISGTGKITAAPNIAVTNVGLITEKANVAEAQAENSKKMNALIGAMQEIGISKDDIKTAQYQINPKYSYDQKSGSNITGYSVSQSVEVKIRDLSKISAVLAKAGEIGANQVSGIQFTVDDPKNLRAQAREAAVADAKDKAAKLSEALGVKLGEVIGFNESIGDSTQPRPYMAMDSMKGGYAEAAPPDIQSGTLDIVSDVTITYELE